MYPYPIRPLQPRAQFLRRLANSAAVGLALISGSLVVGMLGYHFLEDLNWIDAFVNAAMILSGMGPLANPRTFDGKLFAGCYALYSGLLLLIAAGVFFAPLFHRAMHRFHLEEEDSGKDDAGGPPPQNAAAGPPKRNGRVRRPPRRKTAAS